jgi:cell division protein FtsL
VLLAGIVAMQVEVLKLNAGIGRSIEQTTALQTRNQALETAVAQAGDYQRIESAAARLGMAMSAPGAIRFIGDDVQAVLGKALAAIHEPDSTSFAATQAATAAASDPAATLAATTTSEPAATDPATTGDSAAVAATATATGLPSGN